MSQRLEFVQMASSEQANIRQLCRHFNISAPTAYKWLSRFQQSGQPEPDEYNIIAFTFDGEEMAEGFNATFRRVIRLCQPK